jgi:Domain of unknown function (DUF4157)
MKDGTRFLKPKTTRPPAAPTVARSAVPSIVHDVLREPGRPLDASTRAFFEPRFGADFGEKPSSAASPRLSLSLGSPTDPAEGEATRRAERASRTPPANATPVDFGGVRVHTSPRACTAAAAVGARAFAVGSDLVFGQGQYAPNSPAGRHLLAHELGHAIGGGANASAGVVRRFEAPEHMRLGSAGTGKWQERIPLKNYPRGLLYEEIVALAGDVFGSFEALEKASEEEIDRVLVVMRQQRSMYNADRDKATRDGKSPVEAIKAGGENAYGLGMNFALDRASGGRYLDLARSRENLSHFSTTLPGTAAPLNNLARYSAEHDKAVAAAVAGNEAEARARDAFANHYLTDRFSAGHLRTEVTAAPLERKRRHDWDNEHGLWVVNERGNRWRAFGDGFLDHPDNAANIGYAQEAVRRSQEDIDIALSTKKPPPKFSSRYSGQLEYRALQIVPWEAAGNTLVPEASAAEQIGMATKNTVINMPVVAPLLRGALHAIDSAQEDDRARETAARGTGSVPVGERVVLLRQLLDGPTGGDDELAIIKIFRDAIPAEQAELARLAPLERIYDDVDGDNLRTLIRVLRPMYGFWTTDEKIAHLRKRFTGWTKGWEEEVALTVLEECDPDELRTVIAAIGRARIEDELGDHRSRLDPILRRSSGGVQPVKP